jgi:hypothetical protein
MTRTLCLDGQRRCCSERGKMPLDLDLFQDKAEASIWTLKRISAHDHDPYYQ